jgi:hypothetical protein
LIDEQVFKKSIEEVVELKSESPFSIDWSILHGDVQLESIQK